MISLSKYLCRVSDAMRNIVLVGTEFIYRFGTLNDKRAPNSKGPSGKCVAHRVNCL